MAGELRRKDGFWHGLVDIRFLCVEDNLQFCIIPLLCSLLFVWICINHTDNFWRGTKYYRIIIAVVYRLPFVVIQITMIICIMPHGSEYIFCVQRTRFSYDWVFCMELLF
ncbi:hypothetical protein LOK49_LG10G01732 [Camellia lanceoleosa]|uniref:Uncharacterized protein n=1 Tax=Camellia lanceoleosa TaxID=1840588 RepID=A0ACC0GAA3_9ERIC|nr:hypothetical protein LOK49_LG10G01732 [Camellia lanceoleosa]